MWYSGSIWSYPLSFYPSTCMSLSRIIISRVSHRTWFDDLLFRFCRHWSTSRITTLFIAIWSQRIFYLNRQISQVSNLLIMAAVASWAREFTPTFSLDFTELQKSFLVYHILLLLICGVSVPSLLSFTLVFHYSQVKVKMSNWLISWSFLVCPNQICWNSLREVNYFTITRTSQFWKLIQEARSGNQMLRDWETSWNVTIKTSLTS